MFSIFEGEQRAPAVQVRNVNAQDHLQNGAPFVNARHRLFAGLNRLDKILDQSLVIRLLSAQS